MEPDVYDASNTEQRANIEVERRLDEQGAREGGPSPLDVAFLSNREQVAELFLIRYARLQQRSTWAVRLVDTPTST